MRSGSTLIRILLVPATAILPAGCDEDPTNIDGPPFEDEPVTLSWDFTEGPQGWESGFADYPEEWGETMELRSGYEPLPEELGTDASGLHIAATNHSDDVFMFWKGRAEGLEPETRYALHFEVEFATDSPADCAGIGGAPGESVWVKAGASAEEPEVVVAEVDGRDDYLVMNIDKGNQSRGGEDARILGDVGTPESGCTERSWDLKTLESEEALEVTTGQGGDVWLIVGTDSGFEGRTELYYLRYEAVFEPA